MHPRQCFDTDPPDPSLLIMTLNPLLHHIYVLKPAPQCQIESFTIERPIVVGEDYDAGSFLLQIDSNNSGIPEQQPMALTKSLVPKRRVGIGGLRRSVETGMRSNLLGASKVGQRNHLSLHKQRTGAGSEAQTRLQERKKDETREERLSMTTEYDRLAVQGEARGGGGMGGLKGEWVGSSVEEAHRNARECSDHVASIERSDDDLLAMFSDTPPQDLPPHKEVEAQPIATEAHSIGSRESLEMSRLRPSIVDNLSWIPGTGNRESINVDVMHSDKRDIDVMHSDKRDGMHSDKRDISAEEPQRSRLGGSGGSGGSSYEILFTKDKHKKQKKVWIDGSMYVTPDGRSATVSDEQGNKVCMFTVEKPIVVGEEYEPKDCHLLLQIETLLRGDHSATAPGNLVAHEMAESRDNAPTKANLPLGTNRRQPMMGRGGFKRPRVSLPPNTTASHSHRAGGTGGTGGTGGGFDDLNLHPSISAPPPHGGRLSNGRHVATQPLAGGALKWIRLIIPPQGTPLPTRSLSDPLTLTLTLAN